jgi:hypothetical protein
MPRNLASQEHLAERSDDRLSSAFVSQRRRNKRRRKWRDANPAGQPPCIYQPLIQDRFQQVHESELRNCA